MRFSALLITCAAVLLIFVSTVTVSAQTIFRPAETDCEGNADTRVKKLSGDSLSTSFLIAIDKKVPLHKHLQHSEHVYVLSGKGEMTLGEKTFSISAGDFFFIPRNTPHALQVTQSPVKIISVQSPHFDGSDRILLGK